MGPHQAYGNIPRSIQFATEWISDCIAYLRENNIRYIEATDEKVKEWTKHVHDISVGFLSNDVDSWYVLRSPKRWTASDLPGDAEGGAVTDQMEQDDGRQQERRREAEADRGTIQW